MATVEKRHRALSVEAMHPKAHHLTWWVQKWVEEDTDADDGMMRRVAQALADAEQRGAESARYSTERGARQELWSFIRLHAGKTETQNVSAEWLDAFAPELVSGRFADIAPTAKGEANG